MDVLYLGSHDFYDFIWFRPQQITTRLSRNHRVLYVEPARAMKWRRPRKWNRLVRHNENLYIHSPIVIPGIRYSKVLRKLNQRLLGRNISKILESLDMKTEVCIISTPFMAEFAKRFGEKVTVYDCNDDWSSIPRLPSNFLAEEESKLMGSADLVFVTSDELYRNKKHLNPNTLLLPSGTDVDLFSRCIEDNLSMPEDLSALPRPIIGTVGSLNNTKDDLALLDGIAEARPGWSLVLVGPVMEDVNLEMYPALRQNAHFLGKRAYSELPEYINAFDVCLLAYKKNGFTRSVNPTKVFEYLSAGKPVVATPLDDILHLRSVISFAEGPDEFVSAVEDYLEDGECAETMRMRVEASRRFSWDVIVGEFERRISEHLTVPTRGF